MVVFWSAWTSEAMFAVLAPLAAGGAPAAGSRRAGGHGEERGGGRRQDRQWAQSSLHEKFLSSLEGSA